MRQHCWAWWGEGLQLDIKLRLPNFVPFTIVLYFSTRNHVYTSYFLYKASRLFSANSHHRLNTLIYKEVFFLQMTIIVVINRHFHRITYYIIRTKQI